MQAAVAAAAAEAAAAAVAAAAAAALAELASDGRRNKRPGAVAKRVMRQYLKN